MVLDVMQRCPRGSTSLTMRDSSDVAKGRMVSEVEPQAAGNTFKRDATPSPTQFLLSLSKEGEQGGAS